MSQSLGRKNGSDWKISNRYENEELAIVTINSFEIVSNVKWYHAHQNIWVPKIGEKLSTEGKLSNPKDKYASSGKVGLRSPESSEHINFVTFFH